MRSITLKRIILALSLMIGLIIIAQIFWLNKLYSFEQRQFATNVVKSIRGLYEDLELVNGAVGPLQQFIDRPDANTYRIKIDAVPLKDSLTYYLSAELEDFDVFASCDVTVYDHTKNNLAYTAYIPMAGAHREARQHNAIVVPENYSYIRLYFPGRNAYLLNEMRWWIFGAIILTLAIAGLGFSLFYLYRQKFLNEVQSDFIRNITHEFQTPLTTLNLGLDMLSTPEVKSNAEKVSRYTSVMQAQTQYLQHHVENLVRLIRTDSFGIKLNKEDVDPVKLVEDVLHQLYFLISERSAQIHFNPGAENVIIKADRSHLYLAILNIISNALKFSEHPDITITTGVKEKYYSISVKDNGVGIEKKHIRLLFRKFYRVPHGDVHNVKGLGLGLYFVKQIIGLHRGKIQISSVPSQGTQLTVLLPFN
jgi:two-component system phosphate regulon sensor histidine kinase PhoR